MKLRKFAKAQAAVILTLVIASLLGVMALGADVGVMYYNWNQLQKGADAAALAGANYLSENLTGESIASTTGFTPDDNCKATWAGDDAKIAACTYAVNNYLASDANSLAMTEVAASATPNTPNIQVIATRSGLPYLFGRVIGLTTYSVVASATATQGSTGATNGLFPMGIQCTAPCNLNNLDPGSTSQFGVKFTPTFTASGNWQWLASSSVSCGGACGVGAAVTSGMSGIYSIGESVTTKPGSDSQGPVQRAFAARFSTTSCPSVPDPCTNPAGTVPANDPCMITVPAVDFNGGTAAVNGSKTMPILGFAQVYIQPGSTTSNISACFIKQVDPNAVASGGPLLGSLGRPMLIQ
jgi:hypothetical protein